MVKKYMFMLLRNRNSILIILFTFVAIVAMGQTAIDNYISAPFNNSEIVALQKQGKYMEDENFNLPLFRELEIRLRSNDFNASPEDYRLRLGFFNPYEQVRNKQLNEEHSKYIKVKYDFETNLILAERYKTLLRHYFFSNQLDMLKAEAANFENLQSILLESDFSFSNWVKTDESLIKKQLKISEIKLEIQKLEKQMTQITGDETNIEWSTIHVITIDELRMSIEIDSLETTPKYQLLQQALVMKEKEYRLSKSEAWSNIGFIQAEYDTERGNDINQHLGFQLGVSLPVFNKDKPRIRREKLDLLEEEERLNQVRSDYITDGYNLISDFESDMAAYDIITSRLDKIRLLGENISYENIEDYVSLLEYTGFLVQLKNEYMYRCLSNYIDLLTISGEFIVPPYRNYLLSN